MRDTSCSVHRTVVALTFALSILWVTVPSQAQTLLPLQITVNDPAGDNTGPIDALEMTLLFDDISGAYEISLKASDSAPFLGDFLVNVNLFNVDAGSFFGDTANDYSLSMPTTVLILTGTSPPLTSWSVGDRVYTNSLFGTPNPPGSSLYRTSVSSVPHGFLINEDYVAFADPTMPAMVQNASPVDSDGDGVQDAVDACPDRFGEPENSGCPTALNDRDGDGVVNDLDACPDAFGSPGFFGSGPASGSGSGFGSAVLSGCPTHIPRGPATRDLFIQRATYSAFPEPRSRPTTHWMVFPVALIANAGPDTARNFSVVFDVTPGAVPQRVTVAELLAGESVFVSPPRDALGRGITLASGTYELRVVIDFENRVAETDESNNVYLVRVLLRSH